MHKCVCLSLRTGNCHNANFDVIGGTAVVLLVTTSWHHDNSGFSVHVFIMDSEFLWKQINHLTTFDQSMCILCPQLNPDYEYKLWTDGEIEAFLKKEYPWFMETYNSYPYPIQRVDSSRYFILHHHGGFYLDLDIDCVVPLDRILENVTSSSDVIMAATDPVGITNNFLAGKPNHPYFKLLTQSLLTANVQRWSPHLTIMLSSGPLFVYQTYLHYGCKEQFHILSVAEHKSCFHHEQAATWHGWDGPLVTFLDRHQKALLPLAFVVIAITAFLLIYCVFRYYILKSNNRKTGENKEKFNKFLL